MRRIDTTADLDALYGAPVPAALSKVAQYLTPTYCRWVEKAKFCVLATTGPNGTHATPRGDVDPVVRVADPQTLLLPDWQGNNRLDALRDIVTNPSVAFLFMIPGSKTTVRVNGQAVLTDDKGLRASFEKKGRLPTTVIVTEVQEVYTQCAKALMRSGLWNGDPVPDGVPTVGDILAEMTSGEIGGPDYDSGYEERAIPRLW